MNEVTALSSDRAVPVSYTSISSRNYLQAVENAPIVSRKRGVAFRLYAQGLEPIIAKEYPDVGMILDKDTILSEETYKV